MDKGCQEIPVQGKEFRNSRKLKKVVAIYKRNKLVLSKKHMSLKTRGSEKVSYSKNSCSRLIFCNQLIKCSVSGITLSNDKDRRKNSHSITVFRCCRNHLTLFYKLLLSYHCFTCLVTDLRIARNRTVEVMRKSFR